MGLRRKERLEGSELLLTLAALTGIHADYHAELAAGHAVLDAVEAGIPPGVDVNRVIKHVRAAEHELRSMNDTLSNLERVWLNRPARQLVRRFRATTPDMWTSLQGLDARARRLGRLVSEKRA